MRFLISLLVLMFVVVVGAYFGANHYLTNTTKRLLPEAIAVAKDYGVTVSQVDFKDAGIASLRSIAWNDISGEVTLQGFSGIKQDKPFTFLLDRFELGAADVATGRLFAQISGLEIKTAKEGAAANTEEDTYIGTQLQSGSLVITEASYPFSVGALNAAALQNPSEKLDELKAPIKQIMTALQDGTVPEDLTVEGRAEFTLRNTRHEVNIITEEVGGKQVLQLEKDDLLAASRDFYTRLTEAEVALLATHPLRTPRLLQMKYRAEKAAEVQYGGGGENLTAEWKDAFQYVVWSYLLTKEFGPSFAKQITDAHETDVPGQSARERQMDIRNAALGREYAQQGVSYEKLRDTVERDPRIVRTVRQ